MNPLHEIEQSSANISLVSWTKSPLTHVQKGGLSGIDVHVACGDICPTVPIAEMVSRRSVLESSVYIGICPPLYNITSHGDSKTRV